MVWFADGIALESTVTRDNSWNGSLFRPNGVAMVALASVKVGISRQGAADRGEYRTCRSYCAGEVIANGVGLGLKIIAQCRF
jgi:hypothetical protein